MKDMLVTGAIVGAVIVGGLALSKASGKKKEQKQLATDSANFVIDPTTSGDLRLAGVSSAVANGFNSTGEPARTTLDQNGAEKTLNKAGAKVANAANGSGSTEADLIENALLTNLSFPKFTPFGQGSTYNFV